MQVLGVYGIGIGACDLGLRDEAKNPPEQTFWNKGERYKESSAGMAYKIRRALCSLDTSDRDTFGRVSFGVQGQKAFVLPHHRRTAPKCEFCNGLKGFK